MKSIRYTLQVLTVCVVLLLTVKSAALAQDTELYSISPYPLEITTQKTTNIIFPYDIVSVDKGSRWILAQKVKGLSNILQLKASVPASEQSNLTVVTRDGKLYSFLVDYSQEPLQINIGFSSDGRSQSEQGILKSAHNQAEIQENAAKIGKLQKALRGHSDKAGGIRMQLMGIYIQGDIMYYQLRLINHSQVPYDIESIRFFVKDSKKAKRAAVQQLEIQPLQLYNDQPRLEPGGQTVKVFALSKMTLDADKRLEFKMSEQNGGRHPGFAIRSKLLLKAVSL